MRIPIICCLTLSLITDCVSRVNGAYNGLNLPFGGKGLNSLSSTRGFGYPRRLVQFMPVPVVKKVTHHHIHHVIAHKGVIKSKFASDVNNGLDFDNRDNQNVNQFNYKNFKEENLLNPDFSDNGIKSSFLKRESGSLRADNIDDMLASSSVQYRAKKPIRGSIGGQRAEFVPIVIGIIDDSSDLNSGPDPNKQYSSRKGLFRPEANSYSESREYVPSRETVKLFQHLAKFGFR